MELRGQVRSQIEFGNEGKHFFRSGPSASIALYASMDSIFSKVAFDSSGVNTSEKEKALAAEIARRVHAVTQREFATIARELEALGHRIDVKSIYDPEFAAWHDSSNPARLNDDDTHLSFHYDAQVTCIFR